MKRRIIFQALAACLAGSFFLLTGCSTTESRIAEHPEAFHRMSPSDQALVTQGRIRRGMSQDAVYIAWGAPNQRAAGRYHRDEVENWIYFNTTAGEYGGPFLYGPYAGFGYGYGYGGGYGFPRYGRYGGYRQGYYYNPFYDPYFYGRTSVISYPERTVSFENGRVIAYQYLPSPRFL